MEKFVATIYKKIELSKNIFIFKREEIVKDATIDFTGEYDTLNYFKDGKRILIEGIDSPYFLLSDELYCFGYPIEIDSLKNLYPKIKDEKELINKYSDEISEVINIAYYNEEDDRVKILVTGEEQLKEYESEDMFTQYNMSFDSNSEKTVSIPVSDFEKMIKCLEKKQYKFLKEKLKNASTNINETFNIINSLFDLEEEKEEKEESSLDEILDKLNNLTGLENVKKEILKLLEYLKFHEKSKKYLKLDKPNINMFFTGNPGTGKTTVARILGELYYKMGYVKCNKFAEVTPRQFIAEYVGQTAVKTADFINKNKGGVIFIDEAYVFNSDAARFSNEAIVEILKELEKNETAFIFAGYKDEMENFIKMNPGLSSRIGYYIEYMNYTEEELYTIFYKKIEKMGFLIEDKLEKKIKKNLSKVKENRDFGNGRYIDKLIQKLILEHSINIKNFKQKNKMITLTEKDFTEEMENTLIFKEKVKKLGF